MKYEMKNKFLCVSFDQGHRSSRAWSMEHERRWLGCQYCAEARGWTRQSGYSQSTRWWRRRCDHCTVVSVMSSVIHILWDCELCVRRNLGKLLINAVRRFQIYSDLKKRVWCVGAGAINYLNSAMHVAWYLVNSGSFRRNYRGDFLNNPPFGWFSINGLKWCSINNVDRSGLELNTILRNNVLQFPIFCFQ